MSSPGWILCSDELPEEDIPVMVYTRRGETRAMVYEPDLEGVSWWDLELEQDISARYVIGWLRVPPIPASWLSK